jgi:hypothetical protein
VHRDVVFVNFDFDFVVALIRGVRCVHKQILRVQLCARFRRWHLESNGLFSCSNRRSITSPVVGSSMAICWKREWKSQPIINITRLLSSEPWSITVAKSTRLRGEPTALSNQ